MVALLDPCSTNLETTSGRLKVEKFAEPEPPSPHVTGTNQDEDDTSRGDINTAAALRAQYAIETPRVTRRRHKKVTNEEENEPLVDKTASLRLRSKRTERLQKKQQRRTEKAAQVESAKTSITDLPHELLEEVLCHLRPSDVFCLMRTCRTINQFILNAEKTVAKALLKRRYWILHRCFPLPIAFNDVAEDVRPALLSDKRQEMLNIHRKSYYQHIHMIDPHEICTCLTCVFAWNNLCLIIDLNHWQRNLSQREPIPMIPRGQNPSWNQDLLRRNASIVRQAMDQPLRYALILERHLDTTVGAIARNSRWKKKGQTTSNPAAYQMTEHDVAEGTDRFLERKGKATYDFPFHRDNYYTIEAYIPNRKWSDETRKWYYYDLAPAQHERDLEWVRSSVKPATQERINQRLAALRLRTA